MSNLQLILLALIVVGVVWQLILGIGAMVLITKGHKVTTMGLGPLLVATLAFVAFLFTR